MKFSDYIDINPKIDMLKGKVYPFVKMSNVGVNRREPLTIEKKEFTSGSKFQDGDSVFAKIGSSLERKKSFYCKNIGTGFGSTEFLVFRPKNKLIDDKFLYYFLKTEYIQKNMLSSLSGSTRQRVDKNVFDALNISIPDINDQKKIGDILFAYDDLIENNNKRIKILEQVAQFFYKKLFFNFNFLNFEIKKFINELPYDWKIKSLGDFGINLESGSRPEGGIDYLLNDGVPSIGAGSINGLAEFDYSSVKYIPYDYYIKMRSGKFKGNSILIYKDGKYIGKTTIFRDEFPFQNFAVNEHVFLLETNDFIYQNYLYFTLHLKEYYQLMQNLNKNSAQPGLTQQDIKNIKILIPSKKVINDFNAIVEPILEKIFSLAKININLGEQRDLLLVKLVEIA